MGLLQGRKEFLADDDNAVVVVVVVVVVDVDVGDDDGGEDEPMIGNDDLYKCRSSSSASSLS